MDSDEDWDPTMLKGYMVGKCGNSITYVFYFFLFGWWKVGGGWGPTFLVFNFPYNTMVNSLDIGVYRYI